MDTENDSSPEYLVKMGLDAYEYQCGRGYVTQEAAWNLMLRRSMGLPFLHSPYYISLSGIERRKAFRKH